MRTELEIKNDNYYITLIDFKYDNMVFIFDAPNQALDFIEKMNGADIEFMRDHAEWIISSRHFLNGRSDILSVELKDGSYIKFFGTRKSLAVIAYDKMTNENFETIIKNNFDKFTELVLDALENYKVSIDTLREFN